MMDWIYIAISWILLRWHDLWHAILPDRAFLATNWDWILAIGFLVITVRVVLFPIFVKQIRSQRAMQALQPKMKELQTKYKGDQQTLRQEMMKLYQTEKVNPLMGCLPMFLQIPVFLGLFHVLNRLDPLQVKNTTLYTWTQAQWDSAVVARIFDAPIAAKFASSSTDLANMHASGVTVKVVAGVLVMIMMATTFLTSRQMILKTGWSQDPQQRMIQKLMLYGIPVSLLLSGWYFPLGVIIYWVTQNLFSLGQQHWVLHKYPPPVTAGNIPMKAARSSATSAARSPLGAVGRFLSVSTDPAARPAKPASVGRVARLVAQARSVLRRSGGRAAVEPTPPATPVEGISRAPRPGARPVHPRQAAAMAEPPRSPASLSVSGPGSLTVSNAPGNGAVTPAGGADPASSARAGGGGPSLDRSTQRESVTAPGVAMPANAAAVPTSAQAAGTPQSAELAKAATAKSGSGTKKATSGKPTARSGAKKASGKPRKAQASRKGGARR